MKKITQGGMLGNKLRQKRKLNIIKGICMMFALFLAIGTYASTEHSKITNLIVGGAAVLATAPIVGTEADEEKLIEKINLNVKSLLDKETAPTKKELKEFADKLKALEEKGIIPKDVKDEMIEFAKDIKALKEKSKSNADNQRKSIATQLKSYLEENKEKWDAFKSEKKGTFEIELDLKAAGTMTVAGNTNSSNYLPQIEMVPGYVDLVRNRPFLEQYANTSGTNRSRIVWVEKVNPDGQAEFIGEGELKPLIDFEWKTNRSDAKKVADKIKVSTEMLDDIEFMAAAIQNELAYQVDILVDDELLTGDGLGDNLKGIDAYAGGYVLTSLTTTDPNNADAIRAGGAQLASLNFLATHAFINPIDAANMDMIKTVDGMYTIPPFKTADGTRIGGVRVIETNQIPVGSVLIADMTKFTVRNYKAFRTTMGWVNDDFEKNLVTFIGERRLHSYIADNHTGAFIYDTFANIKTALMLP